ncbi:hypothetical protein OG883_44900 [Streptomyces sp. NBC_01142]|uniref:hypothetical protein n=1 Tax=Streptomyces sp. NBC_01142 TaxID=2975865 RepID=UPI00225AA973|nr:hypothetical protein [Streptomyces sp. NBC_01142]MCX4826785.1 hypothetical protein [Streptomyces sp. NBC_01142]
MEQLPVEITIHRVYEDGIVEDLICPQGHDLWRALDFVQRVIAKGHWVLIVPDQGSGLIAEVSAPIAPGLLSEIVSKAIDAGQSTLVLPQTIDRSGILPVLRSLSADPS